MELVSEAADDAFGRFLRSCAGDGGYGDVGFVFEFPICEGPFVVVGDCAVEGLFGDGAAGDLGLDVAAGSAEVVEGSDGCWEEG